MNRKVRRQQAAIQKRIRSGGSEFDRQIGQLTESLKQVEGLGSDLGPLVEQISDLDEKFDEAQEAMQELLHQNQALYQELQDHKTTFLWLLSEVSDASLEQLEERFALGLKTLQEQRK